MQPARTPLPALTGIRFLAAIHVVCFHYAPSLPGFLGNIVHNGFMAVGLFFILSGFVLAYNYADRPLNPGKFWIARFARIYPAYLLGFLLIAPAVVIRLHADPGKLAASGLAAGSLLQGWIPSLALVWNGPGWSLSNEAFFYLLFPVLLPVLARLPERGLWLAAAACCVAAVIPPMVDAGEGVMYVPLFRLGEFVLGVVAGLLFLRVERPRRLMSWLLAGSSAALALTAAMPTLLNGAVAAPLFAVFVFTLAAHPGGFLLWKPIYRLGEASYALYILQSPVMAYFLFATRGMAARTPLSWGEFLVYCAVLIVASLACYRWIETPARRWIVRRASGAGRLSTWGSLRAGSDPAIDPAIRTAG